MTMIMAWLRVQDVSAFCRISRAFHVLYTRWCGGGNHPGSGPLFQDAVPLTMDAKSGHLSYCKPSYQLETVTPWSNTVSSHSDVWCEHELELLTCICMSLSHEYISRSNVQKNWLKIILYHGKKMFVLNQVLGVWKLQSNKRYMTMHLEILGHL